MTSRLPAVVDTLFLAHRGLLGCRCPCGFVVTAISLESVNAALFEHARWKHLPAEAELAQNTDEPVNNTD